ncbi:MAG TPA: YkgJ family cysteine cluster protein [Planctomycetaceae bacterium]|nr:YkgJ family cysteine cluster protein [Planctomycetaceae bacterium]
MSTEPVTLPVLGPQSCTGCGCCCEGIGSPVAIYASRRSFGSHHPFRPADLPTALIAEIDEHFSGLMRGQESQAQCLWFDPVVRQCRHYEFRPPLCREYELGGRACLALRRERGIA